MRERATRTIIANCCLTATQAPEEFEFSISEILHMQSTPFFSSFFSFRGTGGGGFGGWGWGWVEKQFQRNGETCTIIILSSSSFFSSFFLSFLIPIGLHSTVMLPSFSYRPTLLLVELAHQT